MIKPIHLYDLEVQNAVKYILYKMRTALGRMQRYIEVYLF